MLRPILRPPLVTAIVAFSLGASCQTDAGTPQQAPAPSTAESGKSKPALSAPDPAVWYSRIRSHNKQGDSRRAAELCARAAEQLGGEPQCKTAGIHYECGSAHRLLGSLEKASESHHQALEVSRRLGCLAEEASALYGLAQVARSRGNLHLAVRRFRRALEIYEQLERPKSAASALHGIGTLLIQLDELDAALDHFYRARDLRLETGGDPSAALTQMGFVLSLKGENEMASVHLEQVLTGFRSEGKKRKAAVALDHLGRVHRQLGATERALARHREALRIFLDFGDQGSVANTRINIALVHLDRDQLQPAEEQLKAARQVLDDFSDLNAEAHAEGLLALVARRRGDFTTARSHLEAALSGVEELRRKTPGRRLRMSHFATWQDYYSLYVDVLMELDRHQPEQGWAAGAFHAAEQARSRSLLDALAAKPPKAVGGSDPELVGKERFLRDKIATTNLQLLMRNPGDREVPDPDSERALRQLLLEYELLRAEIDSSTDTATESRAEIDPSAPALRLEGVQRLLDADTLLLSYFLGTERSFLWLVSRRSFESVQLAGRKEIESLAEQTHRLLSESQNPMALSQARLIAHHLSELILAPAAHRLDAKRLLIVGDDKLHNIPFAALPAPVHDTAVAPAFLNQRHEIVQLPSASVLGLLRQRRSRQEAGGHRLLLVGDPDLAPSSRLRRLPSSRLEVESIRALAPADEVMALTGHFAGKDEVLRALRTPARIVHLASHGLLNDRHPELSTMVLSQIDEHGGVRDGLLYLYEVLDLRLSVDLVTLSACETAGGRLVRGEGLISLTHGFLAAGAKRVLATLWRIDDRASAELMSEFYRGLLDHGLPPSAALRKAQLAMLENPRWRAPYYWAGFVIQGDWH